VDPLKHYLRPWVAKEIAGFLRGRWAALEAPGKRWVRWRGNRPLVVESPRDVPKLVAEYRGVRSFYGSIEVFTSLKDRRDFEEGYGHNVAAATPFIDIDIVDEARVDDVWSCVVEAAEAIYAWVCHEKGVCRSIYMLWSGAGMHVRIVEKAIPRVPGVNPVTAAYALVEHILRSLGPRLKAIVEKCSGAIKIENMVAEKRVFTAPLSLHRRLDSVAVPIAPEDLGSFNPSWSSPENPRYRPKLWNRFVLGEAQQLLEEALRSVPLKRSIISSTEQTQRVVAVEVQGPVRNPGRFPVMALLQAARYYLLYGDEEKAKSFGLNRAIFYAWAKYYGPGRRAAYRAAPRRFGGATVSESSVKWAEIAGERVQVSTDGWFVMGGVVQRPDDFERNVVRKFAEAGIDFREAWRAALEYLKRFPRSALIDPQRFYKEIYEPVRDRFVEVVLRKRSGASQGLLRFAKKGKG